jgi:hypothetical protein
MIVSEKKDKLLEELSNHIVSYFEEKVKEKWLKQVVRTRMKENKKVSAMYMCTNTKKQLKKSYDHIMRALLIIRNNNNIFRCLIQLFDKMSEPTSNVLNSLAKDIVHFLLADFNSSESYTMTYVYQLAALLPVIEV